jgi:hypothetical protein
VSWRDKAGIGETRLVRGDRLPVDDADLVALLDELPRRGHAHHAASENDGLHATRLLAMIMMNRAPDHKPEQTNHAFASN